MRRRTITTEELFDQPFKPQWLLEQEQIEQESIEQGLNIDVDYAWRRSAYACYDRIIENHYCPAIPELARKPYNPRYTLKEFA